MREGGKPIESGGADGAVVCGALQFVHDVVDAACGRDVDVTTRYTLRSGGAFVADLAAAVRRLVLLQASAPLPETEVRRSGRGWMGISG